MLQKAFQHSPKRTWFFFFFFYLFIDLFSLLILLFFWLDVVAGEGLACSPLTVSFISPLPSHQDDLTQSLQPLLDSLLFLLFLFYFLLALFLPSPFIPLPHPLPFLLRFRGTDGGQSSHFPIGRIHWTSFHICLCSRHIWYRPSRGWFASDVWIKSDTSWFFLWSHHHHFDW